MSPLWKSPCHSICAAQIRGIICCTVRCAYKVNASSSAATNDTRRRARRQECHTEKMYSSRPHPRVAIPAAQQQQNGLARRNTQHRSPFPSWLPAPEEGEQQESGAYAQTQSYHPQSTLGGSFDDNMTPLQRTISDSRVDMRHQTEHQEVHAQRTEFLSTFPAFPVNPQPFLQSPYPDQPPSYVHADRPRTVVETPSSYYNPGSSTFQFPEPDLHRSVSQRPERPQPHRQSKSDEAGYGGAPLHRTTSYATSFHELPPTPHVSPPLFVSFYVRICNNLQSGLHGRAVRRTVPNDVREIFPYEHVP